MLLGNSTVNTLLGQQLHTGNKRETVGSGVFYMVCAKAI
jgi:hypothetical protein